MSTMIKWILAFIGLITLAMIFPFIREIYDYAEGNTTHPGMLMNAGGDATNDAFLTFLPIGIPVVIFISVLIYAVVGRNKNEGGNQ